MEQPDISIIVLKGLKKEMGKKMLDGKKKPKDIAPPEKGKSDLKLRLEKIRGN